MTEAFEVELADGARGSAVRLIAERDLDGAIATLQLPRGTVVILSGGAGEVQESDVEPIRTFLSTSFIPVIDRLGGIVLDGGTDVGVMRIAGEERVRCGGRIRMVGIAPFDKVSVGGAPGSTPLARGHTDFLLVPGSEWGDELRWFDLVADRLADRPPATVLVNGGPMALKEIEASLDKGRRVFVVDGTGRAADDVAAAVRQSRDIAGRETPANGAIEIIDVTIEPEDFMDRLTRPYGGERR